MDRNDAGPTGFDSDVQSDFPGAVDRLFQAPNRSTAWPSDWARAHDWYHYTTGYKDAADILMANLATVGRGAYKLGPPIVSLYRHHLELALKQLALDCGQALRREASPPADHRLNALWQFCVALLEEESPGCTSTVEVQQTTRLLDEFCRVDLKSETFRYPEDRDGNPWTCGLDQIDVYGLQSVVDKISLFLDCIGTDLSTRE